jgi:hypothetical protein
VKLHDLKPGKILRGPLFPEPVQVIVTMPMGSGVKLVGKGLQMSKVFEAVLSPDNLALLETSPDIEPFDGDPKYSVSASRPCASNSPSNTTSTSPCRLPKSILSHTNRKPFTTISVPSRHPVPPGRQPRRRQDHHGRRPGERDEERQLANHILTAGRAFQRLFEEEIWGFTRCVARRGWLRKAGGVALAAGMVRFVPKAGKFSTDFPRRGQTESGTPSTVAWRTWAEGWKSVSRTGRPEPRPNLRCAARRSTKRTRATGERLSGAE